MRKLFILIPVLIIIFFIITGQKNPESEKWSNNLSTNLYDPGVINSAILPQVYDFTNPNTEIRYVKTPYEVISVSPNIRVLPRTNSYQSEVDIVRHPTNPMILFGSSNAFNNTGTLFISEGVYVSTDGGITWGGSDTMKLAGGAPVPNQGGDPRTECLEIIPLITELPGHKIIQLHPDLRIKILQVQMIHLLVLILEDHIVSGRCLHQVHRLSIFLILLTAEFHGQLLSR